MTETAHSNNLPLSLFKKSPNCLVVGACGFLGSHLCDGLLSLNCNVTAIDNLSSGTEENIANFYSNKSFHFIKADINEGLPSNLAKFEYVFNLAGIEEFLNNEELSYASLYANSAGCQNLIKKAVFDSSIFLLVSSADVFKSYLASLSLESYFGKSLIDIGHYSHHEAKRFAEAIVAANYNSNQLDARIVRIADVYGPKMNLEAGSEIAEIISAVVNNREIEINGDGLKKLHPTYYTDVIYGIIKTAFSKESKGKIFSLINQKDISVIDLAYLAKKTAQDYFPNFIRQIKINSNQNNEFESEINLTAGKNEQVLAWESKIDFQKGISQTLDYYQNKINNPKALVPSQFFNSQNPEGKNGPAEFSKLSWNKNNNLIKNRRSFFLALILIFLILFFPIRLGFEMFLGLRWLDQAMQNVKSGDFSKAKLLSERSRWLFDKLEKEINVETKILPKQISENLLNIISTSNFGASIVITVSETGPTASNFSKLLLEPSSKKEDLITNYEILKTQVSYLDKQLSLAQLSAGKINQDLLIADPIKAKVEDYKNQINKAKYYLTNANIFLELYPEIFGLEQPKKYLILFQNNLEIRPTGGFIGSYSVVDVADGHIQKITVDDIYNIDGQLKEKITPPEPLKKYLNLDRLYLRDANWNPDYSSSVDLIKDLFKKETGNETNAVIAINFSVLRQLLKTIGPVPLPTYAETAHYNNVFERSLFHVELGFTPGSQQKKNFLTELSDQILIKLLDKNSNVNLLIIGNDILSLLNQKQILLNFKNQGLQKTVEEFNWAGKILAQPQNKKGFDYLQIVDANIGANKANLYISKEVFFEPTIKRDADLESELVINYKNDSPAETWPGGTYKNFLQVLVPPGTILQSIQNGQNQDIGQVEVYTVGDKTSFGFLVEVEPQKEKKIVLKYKQATSLDFQNNQADYNLHIQKQPGTESDLYQIKLNYPNYMTPVSSNPAGQFSTQSIVYKSKLETDKSYKIDFRR